MTRHRTGTARIVDGPAAGTEREISLLGPDAQPPEAISVRAHVYTLAGPGTEPDSWDYRAWQPDPE